VQTQQMQFELNDGNPQEASSVEPTWINENILQDTH